MKTIFCIGLILGIIAFIPSTGCKTASPKDQTTNQTTTIILNLPHVR